jgi:hypothetical protein
MWKCPQCGSDNVHSIYGGWGCFDCGLKFKVAELSTEDDLLKKRMAQKTIITNILGPVEVRVVQGEEHSRIVQEDRGSQFATLSFLPCLPKEIRVDSDLDLRIKIEVSKSFQYGVLVVEVTATDLFLISGDVVSVKYSREHLCGNIHGWVNMTPFGIGKTIQFKDMLFKFMCSSGERGEIKIKIRFKRPNPTPEGKYLVRVWMEAWSPG